MASTASSSASCTLPPSRILMPACLKFTGQLQIAWCRRAEQCILVGHVKEDAIRAAFFVLVSQSRRRRRGRNQARRRGHQGDLFGLHQVADEFPGALRIFTGRADAPLPGGAADFGTVAEIHRGQEQPILAEILDDVVGRPTAGVPQCRPALVELLVIRRRRVGVAFRKQVLEPFAPRQRFRPIQHTFGGEIAAAIDQVAAKALEHGRVGVWPPFARTSRAQVERVIKLPRILERLQDAVELVQGPGLFQRRDADVVLLEHRLAAIEQ